jgi:RNA 2',3'-cyclic 3'-phosphodiesterase
MRLFVAIDVGDELRTAVAASRRIIDAQLSRVIGEAPRVVWMQPTALHATLRFIGETPEAEVPGLVEAVQEPFAIEPFTISWRGLAAFPSTRRPKALWVGVDQGAAPLGQVEAELARRLGRLPAGERPEQAPPFHPHVTIGRVKTDHAHLDWPALLEAATLGPCTGRITHVSLIRSRGMAGGAGYEEIGRGRLEG